MPVVKECRMGLQGFQQAKSWQLLQQLLQDLRGVGCCSCPAPLLLCTSLQHTTDFKSVLKIQAKRMITC